MVKLKCSKIGQRGIIIKQRERERRKGKGKSTKVKQQMKWESGNRKM